MRNETQGKYTEWLTRDIDVGMESLMPDFVEDYYLKSDFEAKLFRIKTARVSERPTHLEDLREMLRAVGAEIADNADLATCERAVKALTIGDDAKERDLKLLDAILRLSEKYAEPSEYMDRLVVRLDGVGAKGESLRLRILKKLLRSVNVKENKNYYSATLAAQDPDTITEEIFDAYDDPTRKKTVEKLVKGAAILATGAFESATSAKELLFLFALAYGMRYFLVEPSEEEANYDVVRKLFGDFYIGNLIRFLREAKNGVSLVEPIGPGISE